MNWDTLLFLVFPYVAVVLAVVVTLYRAIYRPFTISSLSSQILENKMLYWGSIPFHWGIVIILLMHLIGILLPVSLTMWNAHPIRLYILEISGLAMGLWSLAGLAVLLWRRIINARIQVVTSPVDIIVLLLLLVSVVTGLITATAYRFGSYWLSGVLSPYILSLFVLQPKMSFVSPLPWTVKLHVVNFFVLLAVFPFSRLVHIITYPLGYLLRPWQIVIWYRQRAGSRSG